MLYIETFELRGEGQSEALRAGDAEVQVVQYDILFEADMSFTTEAAVRAASSGLRSLCIAR